MGLFRRLIRATPKEELKSIRLDVNQPFWELDGETDFPSFLNALIGFLPGGCTLYFEGGSSDGELLQFMKARQISESGANQRMHNGPPTRCAFRCLVMRAIRSHETIRHTSLRDGHSGDYPIGC